MGWQADVQGQPKCAAQALHLKPIWELDTQRNGIVSTLEEATVSRKFGD